MSKPIFVFGSNEAGIHGAGAAAYAHRKLGMRYGFSYGHCGDAFAIPTKGYKWDPHDFSDKQRMMVGETLTLGQIQMYVDGFLAYAKGHPELTFQVTRIGCGLAGLRDSVIARMFLNAPKNCQFDEVWKPIFTRLVPDDEFTYWGTF